MKIRTYKVELAQLGEAETFFKTVKATSFKEAALFARIDDPSWDVIAVEVVTPNV